jgi:hypothetical protein
LQPGVVVSDYISVADQVIAGNIGIRMINGDSGAIAFYQVIRQNVGITRAALIQSDSCAV